jgi:ATP-dependent helicase HrpB
MSFIPIGTGRSTSSIGTDGPRVWWHSARPDFRPWCSTKNLVTNALLAAVRDRGLGMLPWTETSSRLRQRVILLAHVVPDDWPDWSDAALMDTLEDWLAPYCGGLRHIDDFGRLDLSQILNSALGWERMRDLDRLAPDAIAIPSGRQAKIDYRDPSKPVLAVKLQEMFGSKTSPHIADGRVPIVMHLLSPAGRPLAVTGDLARFWSTGYSDVRKDGRGRYPKHPWPDDPIAATATAATKRRAPRP